jgi:hypothetical protein
MVAPTGIVRELGVMLIPLLKVFEDSQGTFAIFAEGKFAPSVARMFAKRFLSGCRAEPCRVKGRALAFPTKGGESYGIEI